MADENPQEPASSSQGVSPETGPLDVRFALWRRFCAENDVSVDALPSELGDEIKEKWISMKDSELTGSDEL